MGACVGTTKRTPVDIGDLRRSETDHGSWRAIETGMHHELRRVHSWRFDEARDWISNGQALSEPQKTKRNRILQELVKSETSYVRSLHQIFDEYLDPLFEQDQIDEQFYLLFGVVDCLINFHELFLLSLSEHENELFEVMDRFCDDLWLYNHFVKQYDDIISSVVELQRREKAVDRFFIRQAQNPAIQPIDSLLLMPIQRVPRYQLLFRDLVKSTPTDFWDYDLLSSVLTKFEDTNNAINNARADAEREAQLVALQNKVKQCPFTVFSAKRRLISENLILEHGDERWLETCCDRLIVCDKDYTYRRHINANLITSIQQQGEDKLTIHVDDSKYEFKFIDTAHGELCLSLDQLLEELDKSKIERVRTVELVERDIKEIQNRSSASWKQLLVQRSANLTMMNQQSEYFGHSVAEESKPSNLPEPRRLQITQSYSAVSMGHDRKISLSSNHIPETWSVDDDGTEVSDSGEWNDIAPPHLVTPVRSRRKRKKNRSLIYLHKKKKKQKQSFDFQETFPLDNITPSTSPRKLNTSDLCQVTPRNLSFHTSSNSSGRAHRPVLSSDCVVSNSVGSEREAVFVYGMSPSGGGSLDGEEDLTASAPPRLKPTNSTESLSITFTPPPPLNNYNDDEFTATSPISSPPEKSDAVTAGKRPHSRDSIRKDPSFAYSSSAESTAVTSSPISSQKPNKSKTSRQNCSPKKKTRSDFEMPEDKGSLRPSRTSSPKPGRGKRSPSTPRRNSLKRRTTQIGDTLSTKRDPSLRKARTTDDDLSDLVEDSITLENTLSSPLHIHELGNRWSTYSAPEPESSTSLNSQNQGYRIFSRGRKRLENTLGEAENVGSIVRSKSAQVVRPRSLNVRAHTWRKGKKQLAALEKSAGTDDDEILPSISPQSTSRSVTGAILF